ncbi:MAG: 6-bladed beta-propeller [Marinilabiliaceae bacterium]|nr:6-bladed beta-propeller [Marinilabiliaceae bacterium]
MTRNILLYLLLACILTSVESCSPTESSSPNIIDSTAEIIDIPHFDEGDIYIQSNEFLDTIYFVPLETNDNSIVGYIDKIQVVGDTIYVLDIRNTKSLKRFTINGKYIDQIGNLGRGPGEYLQPTNFWVDEKDIIISDCYQNKVIFFTLDGSFIKEVLTPFNIHQLARIDDNEFIINIYKDKKIKDFSLIVTDSTFQESKKELYYRPLDKYVLFSNALSLSKNKDGIFYFDNVGDSISKINKHGGAVAKYIFKFNTHSQGDIFKKKAQNEQNQLSDAQKYLTLGSSLLQTDDFVFADLFKEKSLYHLVYSKRSKTSKIFTSFSLDETNPLVIPCWPPIATTKNNTFISRVDAFFITDYWCKNLDPENLKKNKIDPNAPSVRQCKELCSLLKAEDNPVVIFFKIKDYEFDN